MLFDKQPLDTLKDSIARVGILVPLTVFRNSKTKPTLSSTANDDGFVRKRLDYRPFL